LSAAEWMSRRIGRTAMVPTRIPIRLESFVLNLCVRIFSQCKRESGREWVARPDDPFQSVGERPTTRNEFVDCVYRFATQFTCD